MAIEVLMPQMGESVAEGTIVRWLKEVGDAIDRDEPIFEITTDKVDAEIPAPEGGVLLDIRVGAGETVDVGTIVAVIGAEGEVAASGGGAASEPVEETPAPAAAAATPVVAPTTVAAPADATAADLRRTKSTPVVRRIAQEHGVDIAQISGTGMDGRVTKKDILAFIETGAHKQPTAEPTVAAPAQAAPVTTQAGAMNIPMQPGHL